MAWPPRRPSSSESVRLWGHVPAPRPVDTVRPARLAGVRSNHAGLRGGAVHVLSGPSISTTYASEYCCGIRISRECPPGPGSQY